MMPLLITLMRTKWGCHTGPFHQVSGSWGGTATCQEGNMARGHLQRPVWVSSCRAMAALTVLPLCHPP